jgi:hypothetical protein
MASRRSRDEDFGLKKSSGVNYAQVADRHVDDERFERQRAVRVAAAAVSWASWMSVRDTVLLL